MNATVRSMPELIDALRARAYELDVAYRTVDDVAGLPDGYVSKLFAPKPMKNLGPLSFEPLLKALAVTISLQADPEQLALIRHRLTKKKRHDPPRLAVGQASRASIPDATQDSAVSQPLYRSAEYMKRIGKMGASLGGKKRAKRLKKRVRQRIATQAARKRWGKARMRCVAD